MSRKIIIFILAIALTALLMVPIMDFLRKPAIIGAVTVSSGIPKVFVFDLYINVSCNITLAEGWNMISIPCIPDNRTIQYIFHSFGQDNLTNYTTIHTYILNDANDPWKAYNPSLPSWVIQDLKNITEINSYWIRANASNSLVVYGNITIPTYYSFTKGWNFIGYHSNETKAITNALETLAGKYSIIWQYNASESQYRYYNPALDTGTFTQIRPNSGYWINLTENATWRII